MRAIASSCADALVGLLPRLREPLKEVGLEMADLLPVVSTACHSDWYELSGLLGNPRALVRQAAAVKCAAATFSLRVKLDSKDVGSSAGIEALKGRFARQLGCSRLQVKIEKITIENGDKSRFIPSRTVADLQVKTIDAEHGQELLDNLKRMKSEGEKVLGVRVLGFPVIRSIAMNVNKQADKCKFHLVHAAELRKAEAPLLHTTRHQDVSKQH